MLGFIWYLIVGLVVGAIARLIMPGRDSMSWLATMLLGIVGSIIGGVISMAIWPNDARGGIPRAGFLLSLLGAIVVLWIWRMIGRRNTV
jgi:uncharacterized membrane protein YeaQ/YmgE (transglycosylase-associated protein family)